MSIIQRYIWKHGNLKTQYKLFAEQGKDSFGYSIISSTTFSACLKLIDNNKKDYYSWYSSDKMWIGYHGNHIVIVRDRIPIGQMGHFSEWMQKVHKDFPSISFVFFTTQKEPMYGWMHPGIVYYTINPKEYDSPYWAIQKMIEIENSKEEKHD